MKIHQHKVTRHIASKCPNCGSKLNATEEIASDDAPAPGDVTVCFYCGLVMLFNSDLTLRRITDGEFKALEQETQDAIVAMAATCEYQQEAKNKLPQ